MCNQSPLGTVLPARFAAGAGPGESLATLGGGPGGVVLHVLSEPTGGARATDAGARLPAGPDSEGSLAGLIAAAAAPVAAAAAAAAAAASGPSHGVALLFLTRAGGC